MINDKVFFDNVRSKLFGGSLTQGQVNGINAILAFWKENRKDADIRCLAYPLATTFHETMRFMQPVMETRRADETKNPSVDTAIARLENSWAAGKLSWVKTPYWRKDKNGISWLGRGLVQTTHYENYVKLEQLTGVPYSKNPELLLEDSEAVPGMFLAMEAGIYTGKDLSDYFSETKDDPVNARRIINGTDRADLIAGYHRDFLAAIKAAIAEYRPSSPEPEPPAPPLVSGVDETIWIRRADVAAELRAMAAAVEGAAS